MLPSGDFLRIHRSYMVPVKHITGFASSIVDLNGIELLIVPNDKQAVYRALDYDTADPKQ